MIYQLYTMAVSFVMFFSMLAIVHFRTRGKRMAILELQKEWQASKRPLFWAEFAFIGIYVLSFLVLDQADLLKSKKLEFACFGVMCWIASAAAFSLNAWDEFKFYRLRMPEFRSEFALQFAAVVFCKFAYFTGMYLGLYTCRAL